MGMVVLCIFGGVLLISLVAALVLGCLLCMMLKPSIIKFSVCVLITIIIIGIYSYNSIAGIDDLVSSSHGFEQFRFYVIFFASSPFIGVVVAGVYSIAEKIVWDIKKP